MAVSTRFSAVLFGCLLTVLSCLSQGAADFKAKYVPEGGKIRLFIGQDTETISKYQQHVPEDSLEGVTLYTSVYNPENPVYFHGFYEPANWGAGPINYQKTLDDAPGAALAMGLGFSGDAATQELVGYEIAEGEHDKEIIRFINTLKDMSPRPIFLRIGWEFDGFWFGYRPESYKAAFRHIHSLIKQEKAENIVTVWHSAAWPDYNIAGGFSDLYNHSKPGMLDKWYPGDDVVDWIGVSVFYPDLTQWGYKPPMSPQDAQRSVLEFARKHNKPVIVAEAAPQGYRIGQQSFSPINQHKPKKASASKIWDGWFKPFFEFVHENQDVIRAVAYINTHWDDQPMWQCAYGGRAGQSGCWSGNWGDSRVQANDTIKERWLKEIQNEDRWLQSNPE